MPVWEGNLHAEAFRDVGEHETPDLTVADLTQGFMRELGGVRIAQPVAYGTMSASLRLVANEIGLANFSHPHRIEKCRTHSHLSAPHSSAFGLHNGRRLAKYTDLAADGQFRQLTQSKFTKLAFPAANLP